MQSHLEWVRGLKLQIGADFYGSTKSHLEWVRGLKLWRRVFNRNLPESHLEWVRGLKQTTVQRYERQSCRTSSGCVD